MRLVELAMTSPASLIVLFGCVVACGVSPDASSSDNEAFTVMLDGGACNVPLYPAPAICASYCPTGVSWRDFDASAFEQALARHGCERPGQYELVDRQGRLSAIDVSVCPDDCTTQQLVGRYAHVDPIIARATTHCMSGCFSGPPAGKLYVIFDPHCPSGCAQ